MNTVLAFIPVLDNLQRRGSFPGWVAIILALMAVAAVGVLYAMESGRLSAVRRLVLAAVRVTVVLVVAYLLLRPVWVSETTGQRPRPVAVLIDVSESMNSRDPRPAPEDRWRAALAYDLIEPGKPFPDQPFSSVVPDGAMPSPPSRVEVARKALSNPKLDLFNRLRKVGPLEVSVFGATRSMKDAGDAEWLKSLAADQPRTALVNAAFELLNRDENEQPAAIVIVSDGRENASDKGLADLAAKCRERGIPIYVYGVGSSSFGQMRLRDAGVPESVFLDDLVAIPVRYAVKGVNEGKVDIVVEFGVLFKLTDQVLDELRNGNVPEAVLTKLSGLKNRELRREDFERPLAALLSADEKNQFFSLILDRAKFQGREVAAKRDIPVRSGDDLREVLTYTPTKEDAALKNQEITVSVKVTTGGAGGVTAETFTDAITKPTQVVSKKLKVLVVDGLPRVDFKFLQRALLRDRRVDARFFLTEGDRDAMKSGYPWLVEFTRQLNGTLSIEREEFRKLINEYDLLILGDVPGKFFSAEHQQVIKEFVAEGGGMVHIAGKWNAPLGWVDAGGAQSSIADVLPVELRPVRFPIQPPEGRYYQPFVPALAPGATRSPLVALEEDALDNSELWGRLGAGRAPEADPPRAAKKKQLPALEWYYPVVRLKPGAETFLIHPTARTPAPDDKPMPLLAGHYFGKGYVLFCGFDDTWRWRFNEGDKYFGRFWSQCVYQAGVQRMIGTKLTQLSLDTPEPTLGKGATVYARILDENFKPLAVEEIEATLERVGADRNDTDSSVPVKLRKQTSDGEYTAPLTFNRTGPFKLTVSPPNKSPASLEYRVNLPPDHEQAPGGMAEAEMAKLAADSGSAERPGKFYHEEELVALPDDVKPQLAPFTRRRETVLWHWGAMVLLVGLLSVEWFLRKFNGLS